MKLAWTRLRPRFYVASGGDEREYRVESDDGLWWYAYCVEPRYGTDERPRAKSLSPPCKRMRSACIVCNAYERAVAGVVRMIRGEP